MVIVPSVIFSYPSGRLVEVDVASLVVEDMAAVMTLLFGDSNVFVRDAAADKVLLGSVLLVGATKVAVIDDNDAESCLYPL
jgi:hypothetical protein